MAGRTVPPYRAGAASVRWPPSMAPRSPVARRRPARRAAARRRGRVRLRRRDREGRARAAHRLARLRHRAPRRRREACPGRDRAQLLQRASTSTHGGPAFARSTAWPAGRPPTALRWFYYVNGIGRAGPSSRVAAGDRVWWDHHDRAWRPHPGVVGSFPRAVRLPASTAAASPCGSSARRPHARVRRGPERLEEEGVSAARGEIGQRRRTRSCGCSSARGRGPRGPDPAVRIERARARRASSPASTDRHAGWTSSIRAGASRARSGAAPGSWPRPASRAALPVWVITGTDQVGVAAAAAGLQEAMLRNRFAIAIEQGRAVPPDRGSREPSGPAASPRAPPSGILLRPHEDRRPQGDRGGREARRARARRRAQAPAKGHEVVVEAGAGAPAGLPDAALRGRGRDDRRRRGAPTSSPRSPPPSDEEIGRLGGATRC